MTFSMIYIIRIFVINILGHYRQLIIIIQFLSEFVAEFLVHVKLNTVMAFKSL